MWAAILVCRKENKMTSMFAETPLITLYRTEYNNDYRRMIQNGIYPTDDCIRMILGYPKEPRKKFLGIF
jgi:hypothetical protein